MPHLTESSAAPFVRADRHAPAAAFGTILGTTLLVLAVFFVAGGDTPPHRNEAHYLCRLKHVWDPSYCAGDLFLESPEAHLTVVWLFGWITRFVSLEATAWIGRVASWVLLAGGWVALCRGVGVRQWLAPVAAGLLVVGTEQGHFAGEWIIGGFEAKTLAYGFVLFALASAAAERWNAAWVLLGIASACHALVGAWSVVALLAAWFTGRGRRTFGSMTPGLVMGGLLALPGVLPALALNSGADPAVVAQAQQAYVFERLAHHLAPLAKPPLWLVDRLGRHLLCIALLVWLWRRVPREGGDEPLALVVRFAGGAVAIAACGLVIEAVLWNHPALAASLLRYYWFRLTDIAVPLAAALVATVWLGRGLAARAPRSLPALALVLALCAWGVGGHAVRRAIDPRAPADTPMRDPAAWAQMCDWVRDNTPRDAVFLVPRHAQSFKWRAERPEAASYKDVPQDAAGLVEWSRRMADLHQLGWWETGEPRFARSVADVGREGLERLAASYGARYALSEDPVDGAGFAAARRASLPIVHRVGPYTLYEVGGGR
ncbi:MAG: DUF6798 domain-containing protein [Lacipirellulaceae bacterium]